MTSQRVVPKIMILDDEPAIRDVLKLRLEREGYQVLQAGNYEEFKAEFDKMLAYVKKQAAASQESKKE